MVDRCVCHQVSLTRVKACAEALRGAGVVGEEAILAALAADLRCTTGCGMCGPYVRLTLRTGRTAFDHREAIVRAAVDAARVRS